MLTGCADNSAKLWDVETGSELINFETDSAVRTCAFSYSGKQIFYSTDKSMGQICEVRFFDVNECLSTGSFESCLYVYIYESMWINILCAIAEHSYKSFLVL